MTTIRKQIYESLLADIDAVMTPPVFLNEPTTQFLEEGLSYAVLLTPDRPTVESETISLEHYEFSEELELEIYIKDPDAIDRFAEVDAIAESLVNSIHKSKLGGLATTVLVGPYSIDQEDVQGSAPVGYGRIPITVHYESDLPIG